MRVCPICGRPLLQRRVADLYVDGCNDCGGVWFDRNELTALAQNDPEAMELLDEQFRNPLDRPQPPGGTRRCPVCSVALEEQELRHAPGVKVDGCRRCKGIWLDDGELTALHGILQAILAKRSGQQSA
ncbi:MAG: zf-TFIIB domain-containing protein [Armatimonadota bacterium]